MTPAAQHGTMSKERAGAVVAAVIVFLAAAYLPDVLESVGVRTQLRATLGSYDFAAVALLQLGVCALGLLGMARAGLAAASAGLGLRGALLPGLAFGLVATLPMLLGAGATSEISDRMTAATVLRVAVVAPVAEEVMFRGFLFRQLYTGGHLGFWTSALSVAVVFGLGHAWQAVTGRLSFGGLAGIVLVTAVGSVLFSWLYTRHRFNLWIPISLHGFMNLWWEVFSVDATALGNTAGNLTRLLTIALAIGVTLRVTTPVERREATEAADPAAAPS